MPTTISNIKYKIDYTVFDLRYKNAEKKYLT